MPEKCPCTGDYLDTLIQPSILALLCEGPAYGLELLHELDRRGLANGADSAGFYRALKKLEETGKLASCWQTGRSGMEVRHTTYQSALYRMSRRARPRLCWLTANGCACRRIQLQSFGGSRQD